MEDLIAKLKSKRKVLRTAVSRILKKIETELSKDDSTINVNVLEEILDQLNEKSKSLSDLDTQIERELKVEADEFELEITSVLEYEEKIQLWQFRGKKKLKELNRLENLDNSNRDISNDSVTESQNESNKFTRLPKLTISKFYGDPSDWLEFIGQFENAIDKNPNLSKIEKLIYLKSFLGGSAAKAISGFALIENNYEAALELLRSRFGQTNILINSHLGQLLSISPVRNPNDVNGLRKLLDHTEVQIRNLEALKIDSDSYGNLLTPLILKLLPNEFVLDYSRKIKDENWDLKGLLHFLRNEVLSRERAASVNSNSREKYSRLEKPLPLKSKHSPAITSKPSTVELLAASAESQCMFCGNGTHKSTDCEILSVEKKKEILKKQGRCFLCLGRKHRIKDCKQNVNCAFCFNKHSKAICYSFHQEKDNDKLPKKTSDSSIISAVSSYNSNGNRSNKILLQTASALIRNNDKSENVRILFDNGSMRSFITKDVSSKMELPIVRKESLSVYSFGDKTALEKTFNVVKAKLENVRDPNLSIYIELLETENISSTVISPPDLNFAKKNKVLQNLQLADCCRQSDKIDILIGVDFYYSIITGKIKRISRNVVATESLFGWCLQGKVNIDLSELLTMKVIVNENLISDQLQQFWKLENLGLESDTQYDKAVDLEIMKSFESDIKYKNGRYQVKLPWKPNSKHLMEDNRDIALERFKKLSNKFKIDNPLFVQYSEVLKDYELKHIIEPVQENSRNDKTLFYLPHRAVIRNDRATSRLRIVYDASAHKPKTLSLNDCLYTGPNLYPDIFGLLVKFRQNSIAFTADITQAFLQIELNEEDRDVTRFFWEDDPDDSIENLKTFRFTRVLFGVKSSPFLLAATIKHHLKKYSEIYPETVELLNNCLYVDDIIGGQQSLEQVLKTSLEIVNIFKEASMSLHKWHTNSKELKDIWHQKEFSIQESPEVVPIKVLGINWDTDNDNFYFDTQHLTNFISSSINSKRFLLQTAGRIFDPVGFYGPFTIRIKCLIQEIWSAKIDWDDELPPELSYKWKAWYEEIEELNHLRIPRYYLEGILDVDVKQIELHSFSDASLKAYGCVVYLRIGLNNGTFRTVFVASKSRVAPLKSLTLPRLELLGALLSARLSDKITKCLKYEVIPFHWTDSQITYFWIHGSPERFKPFVKNRIYEIQKLTKSNNWHYCRGKDNPSDLISRGTTVANLRNCQLWWHGPPWLLQCSEFWPSGNVDVVEEENLEYRKKFACAQQYKCIVQEKDELFDISRYSNLMKILRTTAWIKRFALKTRKLGNLTDVPTAEELKDAEEFWIRRIQRVAYNSEISALETDKSISKKSSICSFSPFLDDKGILRLGGRLQFSDFSTEEKHPILLPRNSKFTELVIEREHNKLMHSGVTTTLTSLRKEYWIPKSRQLVKKILRNCLICRKYTAKPAQQMTAQLPQDRIVQTPPFLVSGMDFAGPIWVRSATGTEKSYIVLFTCAVTRALHLELVSSMSTEKFLMAFRRFVSRRGHCDTIYSDNAKTFQKVNRQFEHFSKILEDSKFQDFIASKKISWKFIAERAAWWGGFYERLVKSVKDCLRKVLGKALLKFEELTTILTEVEYVINQRPLTYTYNDLEEPEPLTPAHFLNFGRKNHNYPLHFIEMIDKNSNRNFLMKRQIYQTTLLERLWKRWKEQYLLDLRTAHHFDTPNPSKELKVGDVVLLEGSTKSKLLWELGVIVELYRGRDMHVRSCLIKTSKGQIKRPIQLLYPLEVVNQPEN